MWSRSLDDYLKLPKNLNDFTKNGECSKCGGCCSNRLPLSELEIKKIKSYMRVKKIKLTVRNYPMKNMLDLICPFLDHENNCKIYEIRPLICKEFQCNKKVDGTSEFVKNGREYSVKNVRETFS